MVVSPDSVLEKPQSSRGTPSRRFSSSGSDAPALAVVQQAIAPRPGQIVLKPGDPSSKTDLRYCRRLREMLGRGRGAGGCSRPSSKGQ